MTVTFEEFNQICLLSSEEAGKEYCLSAAKDAYALYSSGGNIGYEVVRRDGLIAGGAVLATDRFCYKRPVGGIMHFYVFPEYRGTKVAAKLLKMCDNWFRDRNVSEIIASLTMDVDGNAASFFKKLGYNKEIVTLIKEL